MPLPSYLTLIGKTQKLISEGAASIESIGNNYQQGRENQIQVRSFNSGFFRPEGAQADGRMHRPLIITKAMDGSTPLLMTAFRTAETLSLCELEVYRISPQGFQEHFFTMRLKDAVIFDIDVVSPDFLDPACAQIDPVEKVCFSYRTIAWTHKVRGTEGSDYWDNEYQA
jgi:type VI secretion system secreted protein Hcp